MTTEKDIYQVAWEQIKTMPKGTSEERVKRRVAKSVALGACYGNVSAARQIRKYFELGQGFKIGIKSLLTELPVSP